MKERLKRIGFLLRLVLPLWLRTGRRPVLFVRPGALGDILCTFPAALELKKRHPGAAFIYSCVADFACLPRLAGVTRHVTSAYFDPASRWNGFFSKTYHFAYNTEHARAAATSISAEFCGQHGVNPDEAYVRLQINPAVLARVKKKLEHHGIHGGPIILLHPGPSWPIKEWPVESWAALVQELRRRGFTSIIQLGVGKHGQMGALPRIAIPEVLSLVDQLTVEETVALVSLGDLLIGIDSGLMHIAASVGTPAVGVFGPTSPELIYADQSRGTYVVSRVECQGCHHREPHLHWRTGCPYEIKCMREIPVSKVLAAGLAQLNHGQRDAK
jgi:ADP-heptose:LPS heptosyltransferase